ncbi:MAG: alpha/beta hydrolase [Myxococcota bacterium]
MSELVASDGIRLYAHRYAIPDPQAEVLLLHGYGEHSGRYAWTAAQWNAKGIAVNTVDLRGHGKSRGDRGYVRRFEDYHLDAQALLDFVRENGSPAPRFVFGHSLGGLIALHWLLHRGVHGFRGLALSSPFLGLALDVPAWKRVASLALSQAVPKVGLDSGLTGAKVCRDPDIARLYDEDPLNNKKANARWFTETLRAMRDVQEDAPRLNLPVLLLFGGDDVVAKPEEAEALASRLPRADSERLDGFYHEILNEPEPARVEVADRYGSWIINLAREA